MDKVREMGHVGSNGYVELMQSSLAERIGIAQTTMMTKLKALQKDGYVDYILPFRGKTTTILGDIDEVPFERVRERKHVRLQRIGDLEEFMEVPNEDTYEYLCEYFGIAKSEQG
jgi:DNA-binding transcriptional ArsR family regulator